MKGRLLGTAGLPYMDRLMWVSKLGIGKSFNERRGVAVGELIKNHLTHGTPSAICILAYLNEVRCHSCLEALMPAKQIQMAITWWAAAWPSRLPCMTLSGYCRTANF